VLRLVDLFGGEKFTQAFGKTDLVDFQGSLDVHGPWFSFDAHRCNDPAIKKAQLLVFFMIFMYFDIYYHFLLPITNDKLILIQLLKLGEEKN